MAIRIPTPEIQGAQSLGTTVAEAADTPFQTLSMPDTSFNGRILSQLGQSATQFGAYLQEQEDERLLLELQAGVGDWERQLLYGEMPTGDPDGSGGINSLEGQAAFGLTERVATDFDTHLAQYNEQLAGLSRTGQQAARQFAQGRREALLDQTARFEFQQREAYNARLRAGALSAAQASAATAWASDEQLAAAELRLRGAAESVFTPEVVAAEAAATADSAVAGGFVGAYDRGDAVTAETARMDERINALVDGQVEDFYRTTIRRALAEGSTASVQRARQIFDRAVEDGTITIRGPDDLIVRDVTFGDERTTSMSIATELYAQHPDDLSTAIDRVRGMGLPGEQEYYTIEELQRRYTLADTVARQEREQTYDALMIEASEQRMADSDPRLAGLTQEQVSRLDSRNRGFELVNNRDVLDTLDAAFDQGAEAMAAIELPEIQGGLTEATFETWRTRILAARSQVATNNEPEWHGALDERTTITAAINGRLGVDTSDREDVTQATRILRSDLYLLFEEQKARVLAAGGEWNTRAIHEYADHLAEVVVPPRFNEGQGIPRYLGVLGQVDLSGSPYMMRVNGVPAADATQITEDLLNASQPTTEATIGAVYDGVPASEVASIIAVIEARNSEPTRENIVAVYRAARGD